VALHWPVFDPLRENRPLRSIQSRNAGAVDREPNPNHRGNGMRPKEKAARDCAPAASKKTSRKYFTLFASRVKVLVVGLACWGLLPVGLADWIIRRLHLGAA